MGTFSVAAASVVGVIAALLALAPAPFDIQPVPFSYTLGGANFTGNQPCFLPFILINSS
jgi:hypothetical protein